MCVYWTEFIWHLNNWIKSVLLKRCLTDLELGFASLEHFSMPTGQGRIFPLAFTVLQLLHSPNNGNNAVNTQRRHTLWFPMCACFQVPVEFTNGPQPADVAPAARQDGQMVGVKCQEETLSGELGFWKLGGVLICPRELIKLITCNIETNNTPASICQFEWLYTLYQ